jgi:hypothetical protein
MNERPQGFEPQPPDPAFMLETLDAVVGCVLGLLEEEKEAHLRAIERIQFQIETLTRGRQP